MKRIEKVLIASQLRISTFQADTDREQCAFSSGTVKGSCQGPCLFIPFINTAPCLCIQSNVLVKGPTQGNENVSVLLLGWACQIPGRLQGSINVDPMRDAYLSCTRRRVRLQLLLLGQVLYCTNTRLSSAQTQSQGRGGMAAVPC